MGKLVGRPSIFLDSGVLIEGLFSPWSASHGLLILGRAGAFKIMLAQAVRAEVEADLLRRLRRDPESTAVVMDAYAKLLRLLRPTVIPVPSDEELAACTHLIRHRADVAILASAVRAKPDYLVTSNTRHFTAGVARRTGLKIVTPQHLIARVTIVG